MDRIALTDGSGKWFDRDAAIEFVDLDDWNGSNTVSRATGSQWEHETLYYTKSGCWVLRRSSDYENVLTTYSEIDEAEAVCWIVRNERFDEIDELDADTQVAIQAGVAAAEL